MKIIGSFYFVIMCFVCIGCNMSSSVVDHRGQKTLSWSMSALDSIPLQADSVSWAGDYFTVSDRLCFFDAKTGMLNFFSWKTGELLRRSLRTGRARNELPDGGMGAALVGDSNRVFIYCENFLYLYDIAKDELSNEGFINFGYYKPRETGNYESPTIYKLCYLDIYLLDSNTLLFPLASNDNTFEGWYEKSHIWGCYDYKRKEFTRLGGHLPPYYKEHPVPLFERFASCRVGETFLTTHVLDSLIYVHDGLDDVAYCFGYEATGADRKYTCKENDVYDTARAREDDNRLTENKSLLYSESGRCLLRTCINGQNGNSTTTVQLYDLDSFDLVAERTYPGPLNFIYSEGDVFYGVNIMPETGQNSIFYFKVTRGK